MALATATYRPFVPGDEKLAANVSQVPVKTGVNLTLAAGVSIRAPEVECARLGMYGRGCLCVAWPASRRDVQDMGTGGCSSLLGPNG